MLQKKYDVRKNPDYGFLQVHPTPSAQEIAHYYAKEFYSSNYPQLNNSSLEIQERDKEYHDAHREDMCQVLSQLFGSALAGKKLLDFGCGWGQTLQYFKNKGLECYGCDPAQEAVEYCRNQGMNVVLTQINTLEVFENTHFDIVLLLNVLEHLADPVQTIQKIRNHLLTKGGILVIEVPNDFNAFQECATLVHNTHKWWIAPPAHLNYFNKQTLASLLEGAGLKIELFLGSFPLEMFLLFGDNYIDNPSIGRSCHEKRIAFEKNLKTHGFNNELQRFYQALAEVNLGRQILVYASA